jgi:imidazoleglycerol-phosphate dehydratase
MREALVERATAETWVQACSLGLDGPVGGEIATGLPFLDHMLLQLQRHGRFLLEVSAKGDLEVDVHHLVEDVGITLGLALKEALGEGAGPRALRGGLRPHGRNPGPLRPGPFREGPTWSSAPRTGR